LEGSVLDLFEVLSQHLHGGNEEDDEDLRTGCDSNQVSPAYKPFGTCLWISSVFNDVSQTIHLTAEVSVCFCESEQTAVDFLIIVAPCILKSITVHSPTNAIFIELRNV
jgi:hypothetical protein